MSRPRLHDFDEQLLALLAARSGGLSASELRGLLPGEPSQPTLARRLLDLRARGKIVVQGGGRSTRYLLAAGNELPRLRSRLLHEAVAFKVVRDPSLIDKARERLSKLRDTNRSAQRYHARWNELLCGPPEALLRTLTEDSEVAADLRKESPFTTLLAPRERERVLRRLHH
jgi:hypothetical protein